MNEKELRELDAWIAEHVMAYSFETFPNGALPNKKHWYTVSPCPNNPSSSFFIGSCPPFTTDPAAAMRVMDACYKKDRNSYFASFHNFLMRKDHDASFTPLQICLYATLLFTK